MPKTVRPIKVKFGTLVNSTLTPWPRVGSTACLVIKLIKLTWNIAENKDPNSTFCYSAREVSLVTMVSMLENLRRHSGAYTSTIISYTNDSLNFSQLLMYSVF